MPSPETKESVTLEQDKAKEPSLIGKIYKYLKEKVVNYLPEEFRGYVSKVENYLDGFFGVEKAKSFLRAAKYEKRNVGGELYTNGNTLELLGIGADVKPEQVRAEVEKQLEQMMFLGNKIKVNRILAQKLRDIEERVLAAMKKAGYEVDHIGSHNWRCISPHRGKSGPKKLSNHALGLAIDIDPPRNPYREYGENEPKGEIGKHMEIVKIFEDAGISWGGHWENRQDPMHFEMTYEDLLKLNS